jgi:hypothetical protein
VLANHPTLIDVVFLISLLPNADCVVKRVACNPFMRGPVRAAGYISNDDGAGLVDDCIAAVRAGGSLVIFPEGTRSVPGQPPRLQRGAANIAVRGRWTSPRCGSPAARNPGKGRNGIVCRRVAFTFGCEVGEDIPIAVSGRYDSPRGMLWPRAASPSTLLVISTCLEIRTVQALEHEIKELIISPFRWRTSRRRTSIRPRRCSSRASAWIRSTRWSWAWRCRRSTVSASRPIRKKPVAISPACARSASSSPPASRNGARNCHDQE